jgi:heat shock protein HtpX
MYIVNPFRKKGMSMADLSSTHPPIQERIRILRAMAGGASFMAYDQAYRQVKGTKSSVISQQTASAAGLVDVRTANVDQTAVETSAEKTERAREVSDLMFKMNDYSVIDCDCGSRLKVPPSLHGTMVRCPRCGKVHQA